jgi:uncharacterized membrane protein YccF (DUF307 family)
MRTFTNILWHIPFFGFLDALVVFLLGSLLTILVVTAPIDLGLIQYSKFLLAPFSSQMMSNWIPFGLIFCIVTSFQILGLCISIIGIPMAIILAKSLGTYLNPVHKVCISK